MVIDYVDRRVDTKVVRAITNMPYQDDTTNDRDVHIDKGFSGGPSDPILLT